MFVLVEAVDIGENWFVEVGMSEVKVEASHSRHAHEQ